MFLEEAIWIRDLLEGLDLKKGQTVLDIGSSSEKYRCLDQPFIDYYIRPLRKLDLEIVHMDSRYDKGVDIVCDLDSLDSETILKGIEPADVILCTNLLEHVRNRDLVIKRIQKLIKYGGVIIISVPYVYRKHPDPIDTMYRPSNTELEVLFTQDEYTKIASEIIEVDKEPTIIPKHLFIRILNRIIKILHFRPISKLQPTVIKNKVSVLAVKKRGL